jgi:hypothetical protein
MVGSSIDCAQGICLCWKCNLCLQLSLSLSTSCGDFNFEDKILLKVAMTSGLGEFLMMVGCIAVN